MKRIYLDHAATTPLDAEVLTRMLPYFDGQYANPSSIHESGWRALFAIEAARKTVATVIGANAEEIIFTGSGTEADNLAVLGAARANRAKGNHVILSAIEHKAVLEAGRALAQEGFEVTYAGVDTYGLVDIPTLVSLVRDDTILISIMLANNEIGTIEPIEELRKAIIEQRGEKNLPLIHTDACQAAGHLPLNVQSLSVDLMTLNGSKVYGPKGVGALYVKKGTRIAPIIVGGAQEQGRRAGTESLPQIVGMAYAIERAAGMQEEESRRLRALRAHFVEGLCSRIPGILVNGHPERVLPHIVHVTVPFIEGESMVLMLDRKGIEAATGSACSMQDLKPSHVLLAIGHKDASIHGSVRFSFGHSTDTKALDHVLDVFPSIVQKLQGASVLTSHAYGRRT